jgi:hypothetical protein
MLSHRLCVKILLIISNTTTELFVVDMCRPKDIRTDAGVSEASSHAEAEIQISEQDDGLDTLAFYELHEHQERAQEDRPVFRRVEGRALPDVLEISRYIVMSAEITSAEDVFTQVLANAVDLAVVRSTDMIEKSTGGTREEIVHGDEGIMMGLRLERNACTGRP